MPLAAGGRNIKATLADKLSKPGSLTKDELAKINALTEFNVFLWSNPDPARSILMLDR